MSTANINHAIYSSNKSVCVAPQATFLILQFEGSWSTYFKDKVYPELLSSFCYLPSCPYLPLPAIKRWPAFVKKAV